MADTTTTNLSLIKPEIGAAEDTWGISINSNLDTIDGLFGSSGSTVNFGSVQVAGTNGVNIQQGAISIKNGGTQSRVDFYCESSNAHYARLQAPAHSAFGGNVTITLPTSTGNLIGTGDSSTVTNTMLAGSIANAKLANSSATLNSQTLTLGGSLTLDTDNIGEGSSNLYFTNERVDDRVNALLVAGSNITLTYDDAGNTLTIASSGGGSGTVTEAFKTISVSGQDNIVADSATDTLTVAAGSGITLTTNASTDTLTITNSGSASNSFETIAVSGQSNVVADSGTDTLTLVAGSNMTITTDASTDTITFASTGGSGGSGTNMDTNIFAGDGTTTAFTVSSTVSNENNLMVFIDGVFQAQNVYSVSGTTLTFATAPADGRVITVYHSTTTVGGSNNTLDTMTGDNSDTTLTLSTAPVHENNVSVYFDGVYQSKSNYSVSGTTLTFSTAPPTGVLVEAITATNTSITTATQLSDADGDTKVMVEESSDEDKIRFDTGGTERAIIDSTGLGIGTSSPSAPLTVSTTGSGDAVIIESTEAGSSNAPDLVLHRNSASPADDDSLGIIRFRGENDASEAIDLINIFGQVTDVSDGSEDSTLYFKTYTDGAEQSPLTLVGANVGIGETSPTAGVKLHITNATQVNQYLESTGNTTNSILQNGADGNSAYIYNRANLPLTFGTNNTERMRIDSSGVVDIKSGGSASTPSLIFEGDTDTGFFHGTNVLAIATAGSERLRINDSGHLMLGKTNSSVSNAGTYLGATGSSFFTLNSTGAVNTLHVYDEVDSAYRFYVRATGSAAGTIFATNTAISGASDERLKENIKDLETGLTEIMALKPRRFDWKEGEGNGTKNNAGFIAQEIETVLPELVGDYLHKELDDVKSVRTGDILPTLVKAVQEQQTIIETQQTTIDDLKSRIETLEVGE